MISNFLQRIFRTNLIAKKQIGAKNNNDHGQYKNKNDHIKVDKQNKNKFVSDTEHLAFSVDEKQYNIKL